jgi:pimeloyl-ACP methyl ester carboxylesterase
MAQRAGWMVFVALATCGCEMSGASGAGDAEGTVDVAAAVTLAPCKRTDGTRLDPNTEWYFPSLWKCGNRGGATLYANADKKTAVGTMISTNSWFACYRRGAMHNGGNNVWYYTLGDTTVPGLTMRLDTHQGAWGYMPAENVLTPSDPSPGVPPCPEASSPPARSDGWGLSTYPIYGKAVLFVHGYDPDATGWACRDIPLASGKTDPGYWQKAIDSFYAGSGTPPEAMKGIVFTWGYYAKDRNCDIQYNGTISTPIRTVGSQLAWDIYERWSRWGQPVDVVAHSMGGLVIRAALTGVEKGEFGPRGTGFPPYLYVEDVVTLSTPHRGTVSADACATKLVRQCIDMGRDSDFLRWLGDNPQSAMGTDWTLLGSETDIIIEPYSAIAAKYDGVPVKNMPVGHKLVYPAGEPMDHDDMKEVTGGIVVAQYCDAFNQDCDMSDATAWPVEGIDFAPIKIARLATFHERLW